jgi:tetratricopeptide (TPR) repeat protein
LTYRKPSLGLFLSTLVIISFFTFSNTFQNQFQLAHGQQQTSIEIDPKDKQAWVNKGDALNRKGNFSEAIMGYNKALEIDPYYVNALDGKGWSLNELVTIYKPSLILTKFLK